MEGLAWLLLKMAALLALAGVAFFSLGWWLRGKQHAAPFDGSPASELEQLKSAAHAAEAARDAARSQAGIAESEIDAVRKELGLARSQIESAGIEIRRLQLTEQERAAPAPVVENAPELDLVPLQKAPAPPKRKAPRKPRAKKSKA